MSQLNAFTILMLVLFLNWTTASNDILVGTYGGPVYKVSLETNTKSPVLAIENASWMRKVNNTMLVVDEFASSIYVVNSNFAITKVQNLKEVHGPVAISRPIGIYNLISGFGAGWPDPVPNTAGLTRYSQQNMDFTEFRFRDLQQHRLHYVDIFQPISGQTFFIAVEYEQGLLYKIDANNIQYNNVIFNFESGLKPRHFVQISGTDSISVIIESNEVRIYNLKWDGNQKQMIQQSMVDLQAQFGEDGKNMTGSEIKYMEGNLYASLRFTENEHASGVQPKNGKIVKIQVSSLNHPYRNMTSSSLEVGKTPRHFAFVNNNTLVVANKDSNNIQIIDMETFNSRTIDFESYQPCFIMTEL